MGWRSRDRARARSRLWVCAFACLVVALLGAIAKERSTRAAAPRSPALSRDIRQVLSSSATPATAVNVSTASLYARNDRWQEYLAPEAVCPGGERANRPAARQAATLACLINFARRKRGLRPLPVAPILNGASARKGQAIRRCGSFAHNPCGSDWTAAVRSTGYAGVFGENLSLSSGPFRAPRPIVDAWLNSRPHRQNLFRAEWREQGLAMIRFRESAGHGTNGEETVWVSILGRPGR